MRSFPATATAGWACVDVYQPSQDGLRGWWTPARECGCPRATGPPAQAPALTPVTAPPRVPTGLGRPIASQPFAELAGEKRQQGPARRWSMEDSNQTQTQSSSNSTTTAPDPEEASFLFHPSSRTQSSA